MIAINYSIIIDFLFQLIAIIDFLFQLIAIIDFSIHAIILIHIDKYYNNFDETTSNRVQAYFIVCLHHVKYVKIYHFKILTRLSN